MAPCEQYSHPGRADIDYCFENDGNAVSERWEEASECGWAEGAGMGRKRLERKTEIRAATGLGFLSPKESHGKPLES